MREFYRSLLLGRYPDCIHAVTTKDTDLPYNGSVALHTGEKISLIVTNRQAVAQSLDVDETYRFVVADQTHSDNITIVSTHEERGWMSLNDAIADCDALISDQKGVMLTVLTADCVPILLLDTQKQIIAAVHAGWKGTKAQIVVKTVRKMQEAFGADTKDIIAFIGPSIGRCCYEVGEDVAGHFEDEAGYDKKGEKYMLDLPYINQKQLIEAGLNPEHIELSNICTACKTDRFFSYRKECGCSGRFMSMIALKRED